MGKGHQVDMTIGRPVAHQLAVWFGPIPSDNTNSINAQSIAGLSDKSVFLNAGSAMPDLQTEVSALRREVADLRAMLEDVSSEVNGFLAGECSPQVETITDKETLKQAILRLFAEGDAFSYSTVLEKLNVDLELLVETCDELIAEGAIEQRRPAA